MQQGDSGDKAGMPAAPDHPSRPDFVWRVLKNTFWLLNSATASRLLNFARTAILARLLLPEDFGIYGLAASIIAIAMIIGDIGIGASLLYKEERPGDDYRHTAFWLNAGLAGMTVLVVGFVAPLVGVFYQRPGLTSILIALSVAFALQVAATVHKSAFRKELRFAPLAAVEVIQSVASLVIAVALAWNSFGAWSFVWALLGANGLGLICLWVLSDWTPRLRFSRPAAKEISSFSGWYLSAALVFSLGYGLDRVLIGKFLGLDRLGFYVMAQDLALSVIGIGMFPLHQVIIPELASLRQRSEALWEAFLRLSRIAAAVMSPVCFGAVLVAPVLLPLFLGSKWVDSVILFQIFCMQMLIRSFIPDPFAAVGRYDLSFRVGLLALVLGAAGILLGMRFGLAGVAVAVTLLVILTQMLAVAVTGSAGVLVRMIQRVAPFVLFAAAVAVLMSVAVVWVRPFAKADELVLTCGAGLVFLAIYGFLCRKQLHGLYLMASERRKQFLMRRG